MVIKGVVFNFVIFKISQNLYEENKKQSKVFPIFVKMKKIGDSNEFVQIMVTNYWIFLNIFIFIHYTNYLENKSYHMDVVTLTCINSSHNHGCEKIYININIIVKNLNLKKKFKMMHWKDFKNILKRTHWKFTSLKL